MIQGYRSAVVVAPDPSSHYFDADPSIATDPTSVELVLPDIRLSLATDRGVFARDHIDVGTKLLLLDGPQPTASDRTLVDLGAGYGPIACALAARNPQATVWAVEVNARARSLCAQNAEAAGLTNIVVVPPEKIPEGLVADRIWSNPPIRIGKRAVHGLLISWLARLVKPTGSAHLVVQRHLGADSLQRWLSSQGWAVTRRRSRSAYRLLDVTVPVESTTS